MSKLVVIILGAVMMGRALHLDFWDWTWFIFGLTAFTWANLRYWNE